MALVVIGFLAAWTWLTHLMYRRLLRNARATIDDQIATIRRLNKAHKRAILYQKEAMAFASMLADKQDTDPLDPRLD